LKTSFLAVGSNAFSYFGLILFKSFKKFLIFTTPLCACVNGWAGSGTNLSFVELLDSVQKGTLLQKINVGPLYFKGDFISR
jgi:hypothetical protein